MKVRGDVKVKHLIDTEETCTIHYSYNIEDKELKICFITTSEGYGVIFDKLSENHQARVLEYVRSDLLTRRQWPVDVDFDLLLRVYRRKSIITPFRDKKAVVVYFLKNLPENGLRAVIYEGKDIALSMTKEETKLIYTKLIGLHDSEIW